MTKPVVAIIGRPNVGKSTLFNRLAEARLAIVDDIPGTTRDRLIAEVEWSGAFFTIVDTGGIDPALKINDHQPLSIGSADLIEEIKSQAEIAMTDADVILLVTDAESGVTPTDKEIAKIIRSKQFRVNGNLSPPIITVANKADNADRRINAMQFYELGFGEPFPISALHGTGINDLLDDLIQKFSITEQEDEPEAVKVAIIGKPNVGKSSLLNWLVGEERVIVSSIPGTTRDAIDTSIDFKGNRIVLIDTAGIRRRGKIEVGVEKYSVLRSLRAIDRSDVAILVLDAIDGISAQDTHIAGFVLDSWKSTIVVVNKWDAIKKDTTTLEDYNLRIRRELNFMDYVPVLFISAKTGKRVDQVLPTVLRVAEERVLRLPTSQINQVIRKAQDIHPAPSHAGRQLKIYYGTQVRTDPPTFLFYVNDPKLSHFTYKRFIENQIRIFHPFIGTPIRIVFRKRI